MPSTRRSDDPERLGARPEPSEAVARVPDQHAILALQAQAGNQAVQRLLSSGGPAALLRDRVAYSGTQREQGGRVSVAVAGDAVRADGTVMRPAGDGAAPAPTPVNGSLEFKVDDRDPTRFVIGNMKSTPKRTGVGMLLVYHMAKEVKARGAKTIGTDLSALEEGTPEFYMSLGLQPSAERVEMAVQAVSDMPRGTDAERTARERKRKDIMYSGALNATADEVLARSYQSATQKWVADSFSQRFSNWLSTPKLPTQ